MQNVYQHKYTHFGNNTNKSWLNDSKLFVLKYKPFSTSTGMNLDKIRREHNLAY